MITAEDMHWCARVDGAPADEQVPDWVMAAMVRAFNLGFKHGRASGVEDACTALNDLDEDARAGLREHYDARSGQ